MQILAVPTHPPAGQYSQKHCPAAALVSPIIPRPSLPPPPMMTGRYPWENVSGRGKAYGLILELIRRVSPIKRAYALVIHGQKSGVLARRNNLYMQGNWDHQKWPVGT